LPPMKLPNFKQTGAELKNHLKNELKKKLRKEIGKQIANHFASFGYVYLILLAIFIFFYIIAAAIASTQSIVAQSFISEKYLPPQIYQHDLESLITDGFGERIHPITGEKSFHSGIDIGIPIGTPVSSSQDGKVKNVIYPKATDPVTTKNAGIYVEVESSGEIAGTTRYLHLSEALVGPGQSVKKGQIIGFSGNTGQSTGPHLHYEIIPKDLEATDPTNFVLFMSKLTDIASDAAFNTMSDVNFSNVSGYDYQSDQLLYISNVYMESAAPSFKETGSVYTRDLNTGFSINSGSGGGASGGLGPYVDVPTTVGVLHNPFFIKWASYAMESEKQTGIKASVTLAQMALESGWGNVDICNNVFGIKANSQWKGPVCFANTSEQDAGGTYHINAGFRSYGSYAESFDDHANFLTVNLRYDVTRSKLNPFEWANELQRATYATDWQYANKLKSIMMNDNLMSLDRDRGIDPSTGELWKDVPYISLFTLPIGTFNGTGTQGPIPIAQPAVANTSDSITIVFGIEQLYGNYGRQVHRTRVKKPIQPTTPSTETGTGSTTSGNASNTSSGSGTTSTTPTSDETVESVSYTTMIDPMTGKPIINLVNFNNVLNLYQGETQSPSIFFKDIPDAIAVTLESSSADDLHVAHVDYIKGQY
jgi:murein DD-endopeptidase MepM/ murein hydrolase activator NlpD